jgi:hypothetical protein
VFFSEGPARAKIIGVKKRQRRDPEERSTRVLTIVIELAVIHASGQKDFYEDSIPITRSAAWRIDELRKSLSEMLPDSDDPTRAKWNEDSAIGQTVFVWFSVWQREKKAGNNIKYLLPVDGDAAFKEATKAEVFA